MQNFNKGFTLIELMAVIVILGILTTIVAVNVAPYLQRANFEKVRVDLAQIEKALETYRFQHYAYPTAAQGLEALLAPPGDLKNPNLYPPDGYLPFMPKDSWDNEYLYLSPGQHSTKFDVFSYGADGTVGGEGENSDIGNWIKN